MVLAEAVGPTAREEPRARRAAAVAPLAREDPVAMAVSRELDRAVDRVLAGTTEVLAAAPAEAVWLDLAGPMTQARTTLVAFCAEASCASRARIAVRA